VVTLLAMAPAGEDHGSPAAGLISEGTDAI
jgi:hypothetical protein